MSYQYDPSITENEAKQALVMVDKTIEQDPHLSETQHAYAVKNINRILNGYYESPSSKTFTLAEVEDMLRVNMHYNASESIFVGQREARKAYLKGTWSGGLSVLFGMFLGAIYLVVKR